jgi:hypothetical protein
MAEIQRSIHFVNNFNPQCPTWQLFDESLWLSPPLYNIETRKNSTPASVEEYGGGRRPRGGGGGYQRNIVLCKCARGASCYPAAAEESAVTGRKRAKCLGERRCEDREDAGTCCLSTANK